MSATPSFQAKESVRAEKLQRLFVDAICRQQLALVQKRLAQGACPKLMDTDGMSPLMRAARTGNVDLINLILPLCDPAASSEAGSALSFFVSFTCRLQSSSIANEHLKKILESLGSAAGARDSKGRTALIHAAGEWTRLSFTFEEALPVLANASNLRSFDHNGWTACAHALLARRQRNAISLLALDGDKETALSQRLGEGKTLLHIAAEFGADAFILRALPWADHDARDARGRTPLMLAAMSGSEGACDILMRRGLGALAVDADGCNALMLFIENIRRAQVDWTRLFAGADSPFSALIAASDLAIRDRLGESALDKARDRGASLLVDRIESILAALSELSSIKGLSVSKQPSLKQQDLLRQAIELGNASLVAKRIAQGADPKAAGEANRTPLMAAAARGNIGLVSMLLPLSDELAQDALGQTALMAALRADPLDRCSQTICKLANASSAKIADHRGSTPLAASALLPSSTFESLLSELAPLSDLYALDHKGRSIVAISLLGGADNALALWNIHPDPLWLSSCRDDTGATLAHASALRGHAELLQAIAEHSDFAAVDIHGHTPLMSACAAVHGLGLIPTLAAWSDCRLVDLAGRDALMLLIEGAFDEFAPRFADAIQILIPRADLLARDALGESAQDKASDRGLSLVGKAISSHLAILSEAAELALAAPMPATRNAKSARSI